MMEYKVILSYSFFCNEHIKITKESIFGNSLEDAYIKACEKYINYPFVYVIEKEYVSKFRKDIKQYCEQNFIDEKLIEEIRPHMY